MDHKTTLSVTAHGLLLVNFTLQGILQRTTFLCVNFQQDVPETSTIVTVQSNANNSKSVVISALRISLQLKMNSKTLAFDSRWK